MAVARHGRSTSPVSAVDNRACVGERGFGGSSIRGKAADRRIMFTRAASVDSNALGTRSFVRSSLDLPFDERQWATTSPSAKRC